MERAITRNVNGDSATTGPYPVTAQRFNSEQFRLRTAKAAVSWLERQPVTLEVAGSSPVILVGNYSVNQPQFPIMGTVADLLCQTRNYCWRSGGFAGLFAAAQEGGSGEAQAGEEGDAAGFGNGGGGENSHIIQIRRSRGSGT